MLQRAARPPLQWEKAPSHSLNSGLRHRHVSRAPASAAAADHETVRAPSTNRHPIVLLTREAGKNEKLFAALQPYGFRCQELPLIEHAPGPDRDQLPALLNSPDFDWVAVTSPEAATVFLEGWEKAGRPKVRLAVVGGGTGEVLLAAGLKPDFQASKATGVVLGRELPKIPGGTNRVLYPASVKASQDLQNNLRLSGFDVHRINTYNTGPARGVDLKALHGALAATIITFGSPSAVKAWVQLAGLAEAQSRMSVCIGHTSARACEAAGLTKVYYPDAPGIEGWVDSVLQAAAALEAERRH